MYHFHISERYFSVGVHGSDLDGSSGGSAHSGGSSSSPVHPHQQHTQPGTPPRISSVTPNGTPSSTSSSSAQKT